MSVHPAVSPLVLTHEIMAALAIRGSPTLRAEIALLDGARALYEGAWMFPAQASARADAYVNQSLRVRAQLEAEIFHATR